MAPLNDLLHGLYDQRPNKASVALKGSFDVYRLVVFKFCMQVTIWPPLLICYMAFTIKGQTKAIAAFKGNFCVLGPNFACRQLWALLMICYLAVTIKGQTKAAAAFKGN